MEGFKTLTKGLLRVSREQLEEEQRRYETRGESPRRGPLRVLDESWRLFGDLPTLRNERVPFVLIGPIHDLRFAS
jgi:hypothetical protein